MHVKEDSLGNHHHHTLTKCKSNRKNEFQEIITIKEMVKEVIPFYLTWACFPEVFLVQLESLHIITKEGV